MAPIYDCGDPDCHECQTAFGPDRSQAIGNALAREARYEALASVTCKRCGEKLPDADCAEGCEDPHCPLIGGCK